jgi:Fe-S-cluster containining protein
MNVELFSKKEKENNPCVECLADCCQEVAVPINTPTDKKGWDEIRWLVAHKNVQVFKDHENDWLVEFITPCEKLDSHNMCKIYNSRPHICKEYSHKDCVKVDPDGYYKILFKNLEEVDAYLKNKNYKWLKN